MIFINWFYRKKWTCLVKGHLDEHPWNEKDEDKSDVDESEEDSDTEDTDSDDDDYDDLEFDSINASAGGIGTDDASELNKQTKFRSAKEELQYLKVEVERILQI